MNEIILYNFLLILARISSFFVATPFFSTKSIPKLVKVTIILVVTIIAYNVVPPQDVYPSSGLEFGFMLFRDALIGLVLGYGVNIVFLGIQSAGDFIDLFAGLQMSSTYDPITGTNGTFYSNVYNWIATIIFLNMNGHHYLITGIVNSFLFIPVGEVSLIQIDLNTIALMITKTFYISVQLGFPIAVILFMIDVILGAISRVVPQINVFVLGMPVKLVVSSLLFMLALTGVMSGISWGIEIVIEMFDAMIKSII